MSKGNFDGHEVIVVSAKSYTMKCEFLTSYIPPLTIALAGAEVKIDSAGFMMDGQNGRCIIMLERIASSSSAEFRFGLAFLQNFVTVLDNDRDQVYLGALADKTPTATVSKVKRNPDDKKVNVITDNSALIRLSVAAVIIMAITLAIYCWQRHLMLKERDELIQARLMFMEQRAKYGSASSAEGMHFKS